MSCLCEGGQKAQRHTDEDRADERLQEGALAPS